MAFVGLSLSMALGWRAILIATQPSAIERLNPTSRLTKT
jgi:hypothetical protein